jgi:hypothetical protein
MTDPPQRCAICARPPDKVNCSVGECSHIDCPHRRRCWSDGLKTTRSADLPDDSLAHLFDNPEAP